MTLSFHLSPLEEIAATTVYRILWLRVSVFVVEQGAAYAELDGRDIEPGALHLWAQDDGGEVVAALRVLDEETRWRIGRVATAARARGRGAAGELMTRALEHSRTLDPRRDIVLDAQEHLAGWYGRFGFEVDGPRYIEDDIPHVPMRRRAAAPGRDR